MGCENDTSEFLHAEKEKTHKESIPAQLGCEPMGKIVPTRLNNSAVNPDTLQRIECSFGDPKRN
jgi:hypothetical protein